MRNKDGLEAGQPVDYDTLIRVNKLHYDLAKSAPKIKLVDESHIRTVEKPQVIHKPKKSKSKLSLNK